jgi:hypothetical protein
MGKSARLPTVVVALVLAACGGSQPTTAPSPVTTASSPVPPPAGPFPPLTGPARTFVFDHGLGYTVSDYTKRSHFELFDDGAFMLRFTGGTGGYLGGYKEADGVITFGWEGSGVIGPWGATGTLRDGLLSVHYNAVMQLTDFEDAAYVQLPAP